MARISYLIAENYSKFIHVISEQIDGLTSFPDSQTQSN